MKPARQILNLGLFALLAHLASAAEPKPEVRPETIETKTAGTERMPGFITCYWDAKQGKLWLEISQWDTELLYVTSLPAGLGSNEVGLDRGLLGRTRVVKFLRSGPKVLLVHLNYRFRASGPDVDERRAVEESFAQSILWGFDAAASDGDRVLVDATSFFLREAMDVPRALKLANQGTFRLDASRCAFYLSRTKNFPLNTEVETMLTFTGEEPGPLVLDVAPTPDAISVREHHSFVRLPDAGYTPREFDPRSGFFPTSHLDFATPIDQPLKKSFVVRHRLKKKNPAAPVSEPEKPIVYYVDRGAPEPIRTALMDGARWWNQAFEASGYQNAFRVELMPPGADPMDLRYNVIQWVHRSTRGWSYGAVVSDPRTGEILKGHVTLGSQRVRQDFLIAEGLIANYEDGQPGDPAMKEMALARLRQLAAHEVGHTLGLAHNYIASSHDRASVMDYPHPLIRIRSDSTLDLSQAYASGIGEWDKVAIAYGYQDFPTDASEQQELDNIIRNGLRRGLTFLTDADARPAGSAHPQAHLWDNGSNAVAELDHIQRVRVIALKNFSEKKILAGRPLATLEEVLVPIYLSHRYQIAACAKVLGGLNYTYAVRGDGQVPTGEIPAHEQRRSLEGLLGVLRPQALELSASLLALLPPRPAGFDRNQELFQSRTGRTFDALAPAEAVADLTVGLIFDPARAARLVEHHSRNSRLPGLAEVIDRVLASTWFARPEAGYRGEIQRVVNILALSHLMSLAGSSEASSQTRAVAVLKMGELRDRLRKEVRSTRDPDRRAHLTFALSQIRLFEEDPGKLSLPKALKSPDGPPIGTLGCEFITGQ